MAARADPVSWLLCLAVIGLMGLVWLAATQPIATTAIADAAVRPTDTSGLAQQLRPARPEALEAYVAALQRPLFEPQRRPAASRPPESKMPAVAPPLAKAPPPAPPPSLQGLKLLGIVKTGREPMRALVRTGEGEAGQWVTEGAMAGRWRVERITETAVFLEAQGTRVELAMFAVPKIGSGR